MYGSSSPIIDVVILVKNAHIIIVLCCNGKRFNYANKQCQSCIHSSVSLSHYKYTKKTFFSLSDCTEIKITLKDNALEQSAYVIQACGSWNKTPSNMQKWEAWFIKHHNKLHNLNINQLFLRQNSYFEKNQLNSVQATIVKWILNPR